MSESKKGPEVVQRRFEVSESGEVTFPGEKGEEEKVMQGRSVGTEKREVKKLRWFPLGRDVYGDPSPGFRSQTRQGTLGELIQDGRISPRLTKDGGKALLEVKGTQRHDGALFASTEVGWLQHPLRNQRKRKK